jgi:GDSL-like Lipase/Acylhydrolase family
MFARLFALSTAALTACLVAACGGSNPGSPHVELHVVFPSRVAGDATFGALGMSPRATPITPDAASRSFTGARHFAFTPGGAAPLTVSGLTCTGPGRWDPDGPSSAYTGLDVTLSSGQQESCTATLTTNDSDGDGVPDREDGCRNTPSSTPDGCPGFTVASIGDSVASGEGNPPWSYKPCHLSDFAGPRIAFSWLEGSAQAQFRWQQFSFYPLACSGAGITDGILGPYDGAPDIRKGPYNGLRRFVRRQSKFPGMPRLLTLPPYPTRFHQSTAQLSRLPSSEDALLISAGANDLGFSDILITCLRQAGRQYLRPFAKSCADTQAGNIFDNNERELAGRYSNLSAALTALNIPPSRVYITEYFDPTGDARGNQCSRILTIHRNADLTWAEQTVLKALNDAVRTAATDYHWNYIGKITSAFRSHGYCARKNSWIRTVKESLRSQRDWFGAMHPNNQGQRCYATSIWEVLYNHLFGAPPPDSVMPPGVEPDCL